MNCVSVHEKHTACTVSGEISCTFRSQYISQEKRNNNVTFPISCSPTLNINLFQEMGNFAEVHLNADVISQLRKQAKELSGQSVKWFDHFFSGLYCPLKSLATNPEPWRNLTILPCPHPETADLSVSLHNWGAVGIKDVALTGMRKWPPQADQMNQLEWDQNHRRGASTGQSQQTVSPQLRCLRQPLKLSDP